MELKGLDKKSKAKKKVEILKGFYMHLMMYIIINTTLVVVKIVGTSSYGETFMGPLWHFSTFVPPFFWGIGLAFHAIKVFRPTLFFNKEWEERQIQKYMEDDKEDVQ